MGTHALLNEAHLLQDVYFFEDLAAKFDFLWEF